MCKDLLERMFIHELVMAAKPQNNPGAQPEGTGKINGNISLHWNPRRLKRDRRREVPCSAAGRGTCDIDFRKPCGGSPEAEQRPPCDPASPRRYRPNRRRVYTSSKDIKMLSAAEFTGRNLKTTQIPI